MFFKPYSQKKLLLLTSLFLSVAACQSGLKEDGDVAAGPVPEAHPAIAGRGNFRSIPERLHSMRTMSERFPTRMIARSGEVNPFDYKPMPIADLRYQWQDQNYTVREFATRNHSTSIVVLHKGDVVYEDYFQGTTENTHLTSFSMAKSLVGLLAGFALADGAITSLDDPVTKYVEEFKGTGYEGATVRHLLQMSSGVRWSENYYEDSSDIARFSGLSLIANQIPANEFMTTLPRRHKPGSVFYYSSGETQALGWVISNAVGTSLSNYLHRKLWSKLGMEHDAYWLLDRNNGDEFSSIGVSASARDYARIGQLMLQDGRWEGEQLLSSDWVYASTHPDGQHVAYGKVRKEQPQFGYGYQWWSYADGTFDAEGVFGQFIWVNPKDDVVIVKTSVWPKATDLTLKTELLTVFRTISEYLSKQD